MVELDKLKIALVTGTRPELIKVSVLIRLMKKDPQIDLVFIHSGQHYDNLMFKVFLEELNLPIPDYNLNIHSNANSVQTGHMLINLYEIIKKEQPQVILAQGDTNTVFSAGLTAFKMDIPFGHIEAGIRSFDMRMPEEVNRKLVGACALLNFAPTRISVENLLNEGIEPSRIFLVGNPIVEAVTENLDIAEKCSEIGKQLNLNPDEKFVLLTAHRPSSVDQKETLENIINPLISHSEIKIIFPIHPRTKKKLIEFNLWTKIQSTKNIHIIEPLKYFDMLKIMSLSYFIITDSGGLQEESIILRKPCLTLRSNTERPESVEIGANVLVGNDPQKIEQYMLKLWNDRDFHHSMIATSNPFGDGTASKNIIQIIKEAWKDHTLQIPFHDFTKVYPHTILKQVKKTEVNVSIYEYERKNHCIVMEAFSSQGEIIFPNQNLKLKEGMYLKVRVLSV
jgi:UDP-N-acetylglucosamine 2-epimerase (non-hydrolysing)